LWEKDKNYKISIEIPESILLNEIYNVPDDGIEIKGNTIIFSNFEDNGYLGLVFKTKKIDNPELLLKFNCNIIAKNGKIQQIEKKVLLFRSSIELIELPKKINISMENNEIIIDNQIFLKNKGEGTAIIQLSIHEESDFTKETPKEMESFIAEFITDFIDGLEFLKKEYPKYEKYLTRLVNFFYTKDGFNKEYLEEAKYIENMGQKIGQSDHKFAESYANKLMHAYLKNIYIITPFESFAAYLRSIESGNIIIKDSVDVLNFTQKLGNLKAKLEITDLISNVYEPIELDEVEIKLNYDVQFPIQIPIYRFIRWE